MMTELEINKTTHEGMGKAENLSGKRFGDLVVINFHHIKKGGFANWLCLCNCGKEVVVAARSLKSTHTKSCGCLKKRTKKKTIQCATCGEHKDVVPGEIKRGGGKYCSRKCAEIGNRINKNYAQTADGYAMIHKPKHPFARKDGYILAHRLIMEEKLGRFLKDDEVIHHIDGNKLNNDPENLMVLTSGEHKRLHNMNRGSTALAEFITAHPEYFNSAGTPRL